MKKRLEPVNYGLTKTETHFHIATIQLLKKLIDQTRQSNEFLKQLLTGESRHGQFQTQISESKKRISLGFQSRTPEKTMVETPYGSWTSRYPEKGVTIQKEEEHIPREIEHEAREPEDDTRETEGLYLKKIMEAFHNDIKDISDINRQLFTRLLDLEEKRTVNKLQDNDIRNQPKSNSVENILMKLSHDRERKRSSINYGIISEIMPFSDKREIKVKFTIHDLLNQQLSSNLNLDAFKPKVTEWVGIVYRATASVCWNLLYSGSLNFEEVKVLFTENIIYNYIQFINEIEKYTNQQDRFKITNHINQVACNVLEFLCRQYPQTKITAPNMALKKAIPTIENQDQVKYDLISMVLRDCANLPDEVDRITFEIREDKDYCSQVMKTVNYMIDKTDQQYQKFETIMSNIFEQIYLPKQKRTFENTGTGPKTTLPPNQAQYRQKVRGYSSYLIGRKIPKNTPKYTDLQIQYGVFFVKAPSILRIITKWVEQLYDFVSKTKDQEKCASIELKNHQGKAINMSSQVKNLLFKKVYKQLQTIKRKIDKIKQECYFMELFLSGVHYVNDEKQAHLSQDQLRVGKFCSNLKDAISSYVCSQLSKLIYYTSLVLQETDEIELDFKDEDFKEQAKKHLHSVNLVSLKIFDLLRCKCHSNQEEIIWVVQALKKLEQIDNKFQIVRVKDRLNLGTRDIMINAQYDGGLVWEIQLAVTSNVDKKQDMLDKYNHFLYELKRAKLGPLSECVSIWSSLEQRSIYFEQLDVIRKIKTQQIKILHKKDFKCQGDQRKLFTEFKRPIICYACKLYFSIPTTSLLNVRCENCKITYCGMCFYQNKKGQEKQQFMFQNFSQKPLLTKIAFDDLQQYTDLKKPFPLQGFFIKKKFLNRELSYFTLVQMNSQPTTGQQGTIVNICLAQTVLRGKNIVCRMIHSKYLRAKKVNDKQYLINDAFKEFENFWIFYFQKKSERITLEKLKNEMQKAQNFGIKYLNVMAEPNYMREINLAKKSFEKIRLISSLEQAQHIDYQIGMHKFKDLVVLSRFVFKDEKQLKQTIIARNNQKLLKNYAEKKKEVVHLEAKQLTNEFQQPISENISEFSLYLQRIKKLYLAENSISEITFLRKCKTLTLLSVSSNELKSLEGIQQLTELTHLTFDQNQVQSLMSLGGLSKLTYVSGNKNLITKVSGIEKLHSLESLSLCDNKIKSIEELRLLQGLRKVYLRNNQIQDIKPLSSLKNLRHIFVGDNKVNPFVISDFACLKTLQEISLKKTILKTIPNIFLSMTHLCELKLNNNQIEKIENIEKLQSLKRLDLSHNFIKVIENLEKLIHLEELNLNNNQIKVVPSLGRLMQSLKKIILQENPLEDVSEYLKYEEKTMKLMRLKYTQTKISDKATKQIKNHSQEINSKSDADD